MLKLAIQDLRMPMVLDADALNILAEEPTWQAFLPPWAILTPHPGEFDRLIGVRSTSGEERLERARDTARRLGCLIVLKGAWTAICDPLGQVYFAPTGNPRAKYSRYSMNRVTPEEFYPGLQSPPMITSICGHRFLKPLPT